MTAPRFEQPGWQARDVYNIVVNAAEFAREPRARAYLRLLAVLATPLSNTAGDGPPAGRPLDVWGEWERLSEAAGRARDVVGGRGVAWAMVRLAPPTADALGRALAASDPGYQALHISAHGAPEGLWLEDEQGRETLLPTARLVDMVRRSGVRLVVLNACDSQDLGRALVEEAGVACAIATRSQIYEPEAALLSEQLYGYLAAGEPVGEALERAREAIHAGIAGGTLGAPGAPGERAANLLLFGDPALTLQLEAGQEPAHDPWFIRNPVPHNRLLDYRALDGFVGRSDELRKLAAWFAERGRWGCALCGVGGVGKTSLALNAALRNAWRFRAVAFASAKNNPASWGLIEVLQALNEALDTTADARDADNLPGAIAHRLNSNRVLLLLDNLESLDPARAAELARALHSFDLHGGSRVLMTLRPREHSPLTDRLDRRDRFELEELDEAAALRLAWDECRRQDVVLPPAASLAPVAGARLESLRRNAGLPATLSRAALAPYDELAHLAFRHPFLIEQAARLAADEGWDDARSRLQRLRGRGIEDALDDLLGRMIDALAVRAPGSLDVLHALLPFPGGAEPEQLYTVVNGRDDMDESELIDFRDDVLRPAEEAGLVRRRGARYDLDPPVVRAYLAQRRPPDPAALDTYRLRQAVAILPAVREYDDALRAGRMTYSAPLEWANVAAALDWLAQAAPRDDMAARLLVEYQIPAKNTLHNNYDPRLRGWLDATLAAARRLGDDAGEANVLRAIGEVQQFRDEREAALESYAAALALYRAVGSKLGEANVLLAIGDVQQDGEEMEAALESYAAALALYRAVGSKLGEATVLAAQSRLLIDTDFAQSLALLNQALQQRRAIGSIYSEAVDLFNYGLALLDRGRGAEALSYLQRARELYASRGLEAHVRRAEELIAQTQEQAGGSDA
jgi:hypothetical protein